LPNVVITPYPTKGHFIFDSKYASILSSKGGSIMNAMPDIIPISELRQDATSVLKRTATTGNPVFVTQHGKASAVVMSAAAYEKAQNELGILKMLLQGRREIEAGVGRTLEEVMAEADEILAEA
jgi:prevent-host-death family protein